ncbi:MAG: LysR family transcriptional regulator [Acidobacteriia bacterium]|nr:LysR family transcriptional regulator [Terriglobia bacterium]
MAMENFRLKVFRIVAEKLNFREAAEALLLTQPAVTLQIKALEEELSIRLFDRSGNRIVLTEAGGRLLKHATQLAAIAQAAEQDLATLSGVESGELHIGASTTIAQYFLPKLVGEFGRMNPRASLSVVSGNTLQVVDALLKGSIPLALVEGPVLRRGVRTELFLADEIVMILPAQHEWIGHSVSLDQLATEAMIFREQGSGTRRVVETALRKAKVPLKKLRIAMELDSTEAIKAAVEAGLGVGFVSARAVQKELKLGTLQIGLVEGLRICRKFSIIRLPGPQPCGLAGAFLQYLRGIRDRSTNR